jgi:hypothetical protein
LNGYVTNTVRNVKPSSQTLIILTAVSAPERPGSGTTPVVTSVGLRSDALLLSVVDLADDVFIGVADDWGVRKPRPVVVGGALVGSVTGCSAW